MMRNSIAAPALLCVLSLGAPFAQQPEITRYPLHSRVEYPEGIAYDPKDGNIYTGSAATGLIFRVLPQIPPSRFGTIFAHEGAAVPTEPFPALLGMKIDGGRLWVAGGRTGRMAVLDTSNGKILKRFETPAEPAGLINDVAMVNSSAYFTDSLRPTLWRVPVKG
ncbi:MAG: hypothetical protein ACREUZ_03400, partial [Burkholderiales bacterium]